MHHFALQLAPVLAAEKSKTPFYVAGGLLVAWALFLSLGIGNLRPEFPTSAGQQRGVVAVTATLVLITLAMAVITSCTPAKSATATNAAVTSQVSETPPSPEATTATSTAATSTEEAPAPTTTAATTPTATTGTLAPSSSPAAKKKPAVTQAAATALSLAANPAGQLAYNTKSLSAKAGTVTITMTNMAPEEHNVTIAEGTKVLGATPTFVGGSRTLTLKLKPGKYTFYCSVPGHRAAGMEGTLTVS